MYYMIFEFSGVGLQLNICKINIVKSISCINVSSKRM